VLPWEKKTGGCYLLKQAYLVKAKKKEKFSKKIDGR